MMAETHAYYNSHHFVSKNEERNKSSGHSSPETALSMCIDDSFGDLVANDTSERHIIVPVDYTPKPEDTYNPKVQHENQTS
jgi:hypothetical protein